MNGTRIKPALILLLLTFCLAGCARRETGASPLPGGAPSVSTPSGIQPEPSASVSPAESPVGLPSPSPSPSTAPKPASPSASNLTMDDVAQYLDKKTGSQAEIVGTTPVGAGIHLVEYHMKTSTNSFLLVDMTAGTIEDLPVADVVLKKIVNENYFIFEDRGEYTDSAFKYFPHIVRCFRIATDNKNMNFAAIHEDESFEMKRSVQAGCPGKGGMLAAFNATFDGFEVLFKPEQTVEGKGVFYADATSIPPTKTSYDAAKNQFIVELETALLVDGIKTGVKVKTENNLYMSSYQITREDGRILITAQLNDFAKRYRVQQRIGPDAFTPGVDGSFPYLVVTFEKEPDIPLDY